MYFLLLVVGMFGLAKGSLTYVHMLELAPTRMSGTLHTLGGMCTSLFTFVGVAFFYFVPNARLC